MASVDIRVFNQEEMLQAYRGLMAAELEELRAFSSFSKPLYPEYEPPIWYSNPRIVAHPEEIGHAGKDVTERGLANINGSAAIVFRNAIDYLRLSKDLQNRALNVCLAIRGNFHQVESHIDWRWVASWGDTLKAQLISCVFDVIDPQKRLTWFANFMIIDERPVGTIDELRKNPWFESAFQRLQNSYVVRVQSHIDLAVSYPRDEGETDDELMRYVNAVRIRMWERGVTCIEETSRDYPPHAIYGETEAMAAKVESQRNKTIEELISIR